MANVNRKPDLGIAYKCAYTNKEGVEETYLKILLRASELAALLETGPDERGMYSLVAFGNKNKKRKTDPDSVIKVSTKKETTQANGYSNSKGATNARSKGSDFPF